ncbi:MAG: PEP-CTERM sorting domain-containing protein [Opitutaceae bacterium]
MKLSRLPHSLFSVVLVVFAGLSANSASAAGIIFVETILDIGLDTGPDLSGLDGARLTLNTSYDISGLYGDHGGLGTGGYAGVASETQTLTVSGASNASSNGVYNLAAPIYFFPSGRSDAVPSSAGYDSETGNDNIFVALGSGFGLFFGVTAPVTPSGDLAAPGGAILQSDFEVVGFQSFRNASFDGSVYELLAASQTVPEPASAAIFGVAMLGFVLVRRRR